MVTLLVSYTRMPDVEAGIDGKDVRIVAVGKDEDEALAAAVNVLDDPYKSRGEWAFETLNNPDARITTVIVAKVPEQDGFLCADCKKRIIGEKYHMAGVVNLCKDCYRNRRGLSHGVR